MKFAEKYFEQVKLLLEVIPFVAKENCFALKGGTAINMFFQDLPRLSVDLDLVYLPIEEREKSYENINSALKRIADNLLNLGYEAVLQGKSEKKILVLTQNATVKIEPNYTIRGCLSEPVFISVVPKVQEVFGYAKMKVLEKEELYAGKFCAALDRQHPRDLFDVMQLFENETEISEKFIHCFIVYALGHNRPFHELVDCTVKDNSKIFEKEFVGMTDVYVSYENLIFTLKKLKEELKNRLVPYKEKLFDFVKLNADFSFLTYKKVAELPAIKWKLKNLEKLAFTDKEKFDLQYVELKKYLES